MRAVDGKMRITDVADTEQLFRLIQSIPSPTAEPFKLWLAQVASERLDEMQDPEISIDREWRDYRIPSSGGAKLFVEMNATIKTSPSGATC